MSTLAVPILHGVKVVGVFWVHSRTRRSFTDGEIALLGRLAAPAAVAIENARAHAEEQQARAEVAALLAATASLGVRAEPEAVLRTLIEQAALLLHAGSAIYAVLRGNDLVIPGNWRSGEWLENEHTVRPRGISRRVWDSGVPHRSNDVASDPSADPSNVRKYQIRSQLTVPLLGPGSERLGLITLTNSRQPEGFSERDEQLLVAICETGAAVLLRANETATPVLRHSMTDGVWHSQQAWLPLSGSIAGWVIEHRLPYRTGDLPHGQLAFHPVSPKGVPETALSVPILDREAHLLGALNLFDRLDGHDFTDDDQRLAEGIAHHAAVALERAAVALERATLVDELRRREEHLRHQAVTDPLTSLPNRSLFLDRLSHALATGRRRPR